MTDLYTARRQLQDFEFKLPITGNVRDAFVAAVDRFESAVRRDEIDRVMDSDTAGANMGREP